MGKIFKFMVFTFLENALKLRIYTHVPVPHPKIWTEVFKNLYPPTVEKGIEKDDLLYQIQS